MMLKLKKSEVNIGEHFFKNSNKYQEVVHGTNKELYQNISIELNRNLEGTVLDIGNGNVFNYNLDKLKQVIAVDIAFKNMKNTEKIRYIASDARDLSQVQTASCDRIVMQFLIHHMVDQTKNMTDASVSQCFRECHRVLKSDGKLIIIEMLVHPAVEFFENIFYGINYKLLTYLNKPMVKFYSKHELISKLQAAGFGNVSNYEIKMGKWIDPFEALFPGVIKLPRFLYPAESRFICSTKSS